MRATTGTLAKGLPQFFSNDIFQPRLCYLLPSVAPGTVVGARSGLTIVELLIRGVGYTDAI